jgi:hypothetical protein
MLQYFNASLTPYLTEEITANSSNEEIMNAFYKANADSSSSPVQYSDRAIFYVIQ